MVCISKDTERSVKYGSRAQEKIAIQEVWSVWPMQSVIDSIHYKSLLLLCVRNFPAQICLNQLSVKWVLSLVTTTWPDVMCWSCNIFFQCISMSANNQTQEFNWGQYRSRFSYVDLLRPFTHRDNLMHSLASSDRSLNAEQTSSNWDRSLKNSCKIFKNKKGSS